jgi:F-box and leucine-rich repeat protein 1 (S-phase kinase-associated protein 2)
MAGEAKGRREDLNLYSEKPMMLALDGGKSGLGAGGVEIEGLVITEWKDIPMELLLRIVSLVDDRTLIMASGVCSGWRDAICSGLTHLCLSWYNLSSSVFIIKMLFKLIVILLGFLFYLSCIDCI